jgi:stage III sporulation protein SpoIIIAA
MAEHDDLSALLDALPPDIAAAVRARGSNDDLLEVVLDLGRRPEARYPGGEAELAEREVRREDIDAVVARVGEFGGDNRAGIPRTLHRISCMRNRKGHIVGLTCRVGRAVYGTIRIIEDLVAEQHSVLLLGRPGVGKTTLLREVARFLADERKRRVIVVDTSNEIAGDGDIPHPGIGRARRMQVPTPAMQHHVMIEAVENHMPEVIVIDEIGTDLEAAAARTIAERGVQLVATAHGTTLENLVQNPTLADLVGGIQSVTLGDEEAHRRGTQKTILERKAPPTFDVLVEIQTFDRVAVHRDVGAVVDALLRGRPIMPEVRSVDGDGGLHAETPPTPPVAPEPRKGRPRPRADKLRIYPFGVSRQKLGHALRQAGMRADVVDDLEEATDVLTLRPFERRRPQTLRDAAARGLPIHVVKSNTVSQLEHALLQMRNGPARDDDRLSVAMREAEDAIAQVLVSETPVDLSPQEAKVRRLQHQLAEQRHLTSRSLGKEPLRWVRIMPAADY